MKQKKKNIIVTNTPGLLADDTADLIMSLLLALPVEKIDTISLVLVSPSQVIALNVVLIFKFSICFKIEEEIFASVKINPKVVAIFGKIMPDPFAIP